MKKLVTTMFLICAAMLLFSPQAGFAWPNVNQGCLTCHPAAAWYSDLHHCMHCTQQLCCTAIPVDTG